jgi:hypothetical protein
MPSLIVLMLIVYNWKPYLQMVISIPNHKHLASKHSQVIIMLSSFSNSVFSLTQLLLQEAIMSGVTSIVLPSLFLSAT